MRVKIYYIIQKNISALVQKSDPSHDPQKMDSDFSFIATTTTRFTSMSVMAAVKLCSTWKTKSNYASRKDSSCTNCPKLKNLLKRIKS